MAAAKREGDGGYAWRVLLQVLLIFLALAYWNHAFLAPVKLMVVLLHEISHGLMALATGGTVKAIVITPTETGACRTSGGNDLLIISAGYLGSAFFGGLILHCSRSRAHRAGIYAFLSLLVFTAAMTVIDDGYSRKFAIGVAGIGLVLAMFCPGFLSGFFLRGLGTVSCLYALIDIYNDTLSPAAQDLGVQSDASAFAQLTGLSASTIGLGWLLASAAYFLVTLRTSLDADATVPDREKHEIPRAG